MAGRREYESLASAAERTGLSTRTLRRRIAEGVLPVYRCGRILRVFRLSRFTPEHTFPFGALLYRRFIGQPISRSRQRPPLCKRITNREKPHGS